MLLKRGYITVYTDIYNDICLLICIQQLIWTSENTTKVEKTTSEAEACCCSPWVVGHPYLGQRDTLTLGSGTPLPWAAGHPYLGQRDTLTLGSGTPLPWAAGHPYLGQRDTLTLGSGTPLHPQVIWVSLPRFVLTEDVSRYACTSESEEKG